MQKYLPSLAALAGLFVLVAALSVAAGGEKVPLDKVPKAVLEAVRARFPGAELAGAEKEVEGGKTLFEVNLKHKGQAMDVTLTEAGQIVEIEKEIAARDMPKAVAAALEARYPKATYRIVEEIFKVANKEEKLVYFEILLVTADKKTLEVQVAPDGKIVNVEDKGQEKASPRGGEKKAVMEKPFAVKVMGRGRPMILIPGLASSGEIWQTTVAHFQPRYQCHVLTPAGFAGQPPLPGPFLERQRQGVADYIRANNLQRPVIVGHSLGGLLTFWLGATEPDLVGPLIIVDSVPCRGTLFRDLDAAAIKKQASEFGRLTATLPRDQYLKMAAQTVNTKDKKWLDLMIRWAADSDRGTVALAIEEGTALDLRDQVGAIKSPVLLIAAPAGVPPEISGLTREALRERYRAQLVRIPHKQIVFALKAGHCVMIDEPEWLWEQMDRFLATQTSAPGH